MRYVWCAAGILIAGFALSLPEPSLVLAAIAGAAFAHGTTVEPNPNGWWTRVEWEFVAGASLILAVAVPLLVWSWP